MYEEEMNVQNGIDENGVMTLGHFNKDFCISRKAIYNIVFNDKHGNDFSLGKIKFSLIMHHTYRVVKKSILKRCKKTEEEVAVRLFFPNRYQFIKCYRFNTQDGLDLLDEKDYKWYSLFKFNDVKNEEKDELQIQADIAYLMLENKISTRLLLKSGDIWVPAMAVELFILGKITLHDFKVYLLFLLYTKGFKESMQSIFSNEQIRKYINAYLKIRPVRIMGHFKKLIKVGLIFVENKKYTLKDVYLFKMLSPKIVEEFRKKGLKDKYTYALYKQIGTGKFLANYKNFEIKTETVKNTNAKQTIVVVKGIKFVPVNKNGEIVFTKKE